MGWSGVPFPTSGGLPDSGIKFASLVSPAQVDSLSLAPYSFLLLLASYSYVKSLSTDFLRHSEAKFKLLRSACESFPTHFFHIISHYTLPLTHLSHQPEGTLRILLIFCLWALFPLPGMPHPPPNHFFPIQQTRSWKLIASRLEMLTYIAVLWCRHDKAFSSLH